MQVKFKNLVLEVTRRCNMQCNHCMRGDAQDTDMDTTVIQRLFEGTREIKHLTLTGGEPSLCPEVIDYIAYYIRQNFCRVGSFFCATNAKEYSEPFVAALNKLYDLCADKAACVLTISTDQFHTEADPRALKLYRRLPYYKPTKEKGFLRENEILSEGRAAKYGIGRFTLPDDDSLYSIDVKGFHLEVGDRVYINALGDILTNADMSYATQEDSKIGNILTHLLDEMLVHAMYRIPAHWISDEKCVYSIRLRAEPQTISYTALDTQTYYATAQLAAAVYHNLLNNLRITPVDPQARKIPDKLLLQFDELPPEELRCTGTKITYTIPHTETHRVTVEVLRCPIQEAFGNVW